MHVRLMALLIFFLSGVLLWAQPQTSQKKEYEVKIIKDQEVQFIDKTTRAVVKTFNVNERKPFRTDLSKKEIFDRYIKDPQYLRYLNNENFEFRQGVLTKIELKKSGVVLIHYDYSAYKTGETIIDLKYIVCFNRAGELIFEGELKPWANMEIEFSPDHQFFTYGVYGRPFYDEDDIDVLPESVYLYSISEKKYVYEYHEKNESSSIDGPVFKKLKNLEKSFNFEERHSYEKRTLVVLDLTKRKWYQFNAPEGTGFSFNKNGEIVLIRVQCGEKIRVLSLDEFEQGEF